MNEHREGELISEAMVEQSLNVNHTCVGDLCSSEVRTVNCIKPCWAGKLFSVHESIGVQNIDRGDIIIR